MLVLHGRNGSAERFEHITGFSHLADVHDFIVAYPQGTLGPTGVAGWNTARAIDPSANDLRFIEALVPHLESELCVAPARIYVTGFSNGGGFTGVLACSMANVLASVAIVSGDFYPQPRGCTPVRPISVLEIHGTADPINPYFGSATLDYPPVATWLADWAIRDGCVGAPVETPGSLVVRQQWKNCSAGVQIEHVRLVGGLHSWPSLGLSAQAPAADRAYDATTAVWTFFIAHPQLDTSGVHLQHAT